MISFNELIQNNITRRPKIRIVDEDMLSIFGKKVLYGEIVKWHTIKREVEIKVVGENKRLLKGTYSFKDMCHSETKENEYLLGLSYYNIKFVCTTDKFGNFTKDKLYDAYRTDIDTVKILDDERDIYSFKYDREVKGSKDGNFLYAGTYIVNSIYDSTNNYKGIKRQERP